MPEMPATKPDETAARATRPTVALFATCLVDLFRPTVGFAAAKLIEEAGCTVVVPENQTCCGQPAFNSGDRATAKAIARQIVDAFETYDYTVVPSGSCGGMIVKHVPELLADDETYAARARRLAARTFELVSFLVDVRKMTRVPASFHGSVTYHDSCSGLRELNVKRQPRQLLGSVDGLELREMKDTEVCCGFGGTFCVKYPDVSNNMVKKKTRNIAETGAGTVLAGDLGCLMNIAGKMSREGKPIMARHVAEVLADMTETPPLAGVGTIIKAG